MDSFDSALSICKKIIEDTKDLFSPPEEGRYASGQFVIPTSYVRSTRGYIEKVTNQVNGTYENGWYDACAVMIRRLIETLIIEVFEHHKLDNVIKNQQGDFLFLEELIDKLIAEKSWNISRNAKKALPKVKKISDLSAHSRRYTAHRNDIERYIDDLRLIVQELLSLSNLK